VSLCESPRCRRQTLLAYFGETVAPCGNCDLCVDGVEVIDGTIAAQKALSAIIRTGERFGTEHLVSLLCGEATQAIDNFGHARLPTFGVGKEHTKNEWRSIFRQLYAAGIIWLDITGYGRWTVTETGRAVLKGRASFDLRKDAIKPAGKAPAAGAAGAEVKTGIGDLSEDDRALFEALRRLRMTLAKAQSVPAYVIFPDRTLLDMARRRPRSAAEMSRVHGVGQAKLAQYGEVFLELVRRQGP